MKQPEAPQRNFNIVFNFLNAKGEHAGVAMFGGENINYAVCTEHGPRTLPCAPLLEGRAAS